ncbi:hypothetical protein HYX10_01840 [Candidatus Woesearchaeota archaeon]|nr:hypothetical protein [Candidatus Woesearchaeota archaeon]
MAKVNIYKTFFEKNILPIMKASHREQGKLIYYLKMYTHLISALEELRFRRGFDRLLIVAELAKESPPGEAHYAKYVDGIVRQILAHKKQIKYILGKDYTADPLHAKTHLQMAQNICMLRILKLSRSV